MDPTNWDWLSLLTPIALMAVGFWLKSAFKEAARESSENLVTRIDSLNGEIRNLSEQLTPEITLNTSERNIEGVWRQVNQQHVVENSTEHERMIDSLKEISDQNTKQTEYMRDMAITLQSVNDKLKG